MIQPEPDKKATPTDAERKTAEQCVLIFGTNKAIQAVAQAIADQRAKYEAVADELEQHAAAYNARAFVYRSAEMPAIAGTMQARAIAQVDAADRIRQVTR